MGTQQLLRINYSPPTFLVMENPSGVCDSLEVFLFFCRKSELSFTLPLRSYIMLIKGQVVWES